MALEEASLLKPKGHDGLDYDITITARKNTPDLKKYHPLGKSPTVTRDLGDGKTDTMIESKLLLQYISDNFTNGEWVPEPEDKERDAFFQEFVKSTHLMKVCFQ